MDRTVGKQRRRASWEDDQTTTSNQPRRNDVVESQDDNSNNRSGGSNNNQSRRVDRETNQVAVVAMNDPRNDVVVVQTGDDDNDNDSRLLPLSLSLRPPTSYSSSSSSQIKSSSPSLRLAPPSPLAPPPPPTMQQTWSPRYLTMRFPPSYQPYFATSPPSYLFPPYQTPIQPPPPFDFLTPERPVARPASTALTEPRRSYRSQSSSRNHRKDDGDAIPPPYPWATSKRGAIQSLENLESKQITTISGDVQCKHCDRVYQVSYNLREKFAEVANVFVSLKRLMRERAPPFWTNPEPMRCELCGRDKAVKPVIAQRKSQINWLFLLLGQMLGYCTLEQLKNFCKHCKSHRTGAKDRVLYLTYLGLCKMLQPNRELFNRGAGNW